MSEQIIAIHQPNLLPWLGFFDKMSRAHRFVLLDQVQFIRRSWISRVNVLREGKPSLVTIPIRHEGKQEISISEVRIDKGAYRPGKIADHLWHSYHREPFWNTHGEPIADLFRSEWDRLIDLNTQLLEFCAAALEISRDKWLWQSALEGAGQKSALMASLTLSAQGNIYLSGGHDPALGAESKGTAADYNEPTVYGEHGVVLRYQNFEHPVYEQGSDSFVPGLSVLDAMVRMGPAASELIGD
jgi:hypothetical protein